MNGWDTPATLDSVGRAGSKTKVLAKIIPECKKGGKITSTLVDTEIRKSPNVTKLPIVNCVTVTVTAALAAIVAPAVVMMICVAVGVATLPVVLPPLNATCGDPEEAKKADGYVNVILLPGASAPPAVVVNENVAAAVVRAATRSTEAIANVVPVT